MWVGDFAAQTAAGVLLHRRTWRRSHSVVKDPRWGWNMPTLVGQWDLSFRNNMRSIRYTGWIAESRLSRTALTLLLETGLEINKQFNWQFYCVKQGNNENHVSLTYLKDIEAELWQQSCTEFKPKTLWIHYMYAFVFWTLMMPPNPL